MIYLLAFMTLYVASISAYTLGKIVYNTSKVVVGFVSTIVTDVNDEDEYD
jgi:hypothetical protein